MISYEEQRHLIRLIDSLATTEGGNQFYDGKKILDEEAISVLKSYIENLPTDYD